MLGISTNETVIEFVLFSLKVMFALLLECKCNSSITLCGRIHDSFAYSPLVQFCFDLSILVL